MQPCLQHNTRDRFWFLLLSTVLIRISQSQMLITCLFCIFAIQAVPTSGQEYWQEFPGQFVDISAKGNEIWALHRNKSIFRYNPSNVFNCWELIQPPNSTHWSESVDPLAIAASSDGWARMLTKNAQFRWNVTAKQWEKMTLPKNCKQINAWSRDLAVCVQNGQVVLYKEGWGTKVIFDPNESTANSGWMDPDVLSANKAKWVAIGENEECWMIHASGHVYRWDNQARDKWQQMPGADVVNLDIQNKERIVATTRNGQIYVWKPESHSWKPIMHGHAKRATIGGNTIFAVGDMEYIVKSHPDLERMIGWK